MMQKLTKPIIVIDITEQSDENQQLCSPFVVNPPLLQLLGGRVLEAYTNRENTINLKCLSSNGQLKDL